MTSHRKENEHVVDHRNQSDRRHGFEMRVGERRQNRQAEWPYLEKRKPNSDRRKEDDRRLGGGRRLDDWWMDPDEV